MAANIGSPSSPTTYDDREVLLALEILRRTVADLPVGIARELGSRLPTAPPPGQPPPGAPPAPPPPPGAPPPGQPRPGGGGRGMSPLDLLSQRFAAVAGPLAVLGAVVSASTSGFSVLGTAVRVLATTLAPILLPVVVAVATGLVTLADELDPLIQEALPRWTAFIFDKLIPAFAFLADVVAGTVGVFVWMGEAVGDAIGAIGDFVSWIGEKIEPDSDTGKAATGIAALLAGRGGEGVKKLGEVGDETGKVALGSPFAAALEKVRRDPEGVGKGELADDAAGGKGEKGTRGSALMDVLRSLRLSTMPRAQISGLSEAHRGAQMAALNADPLEAKMLRKLDETLTVMERTAVGVEKLAATKPDFKVAPRGDWGGDF